MANKLEIDTVVGQRDVAPARVSSKGRGRPIADLVEKLEKSGKLVSTEGLSSAALRAGDLVRTMRRSAGLSQSELAAMMGVKQSRVSEIEAGLGSQGPTWDVMERVASACGRGLHALPAFETRQSPLPIPEEVREAATRYFHTNALTFTQCPLDDRLTGGTNTLISGAATQRVRFAEIEGYACLFVDLSDSEGKQGTVGVFNKAFALIKG